MARDPKQFEINKLLSITENDKYATAVAAFEIIDQLSSIDMPKKWKNRKPAVQAMMALSDHTIRFGYIEDSERIALEEEMNQARGHAPSGTFPAAGAAGGAAPAVEEEDEDLDEIGETAPVEQLAEESEYESDEETAEEAEEEEEEDSDDDSDEESEDDDDE